jgi:hypothetical protein
MFCCASKYIVNKPVSSEWHLFYISMFTNMTTFEILRIYLEILIQGKICVTRNYAQEIDNELCNYL